MTGGRWQAIGGRGQVAMDSWERIVRMVHISVLVLLHAEFIGLALILT